MKWVVEFEVPEDRQFENTENYVTNFEEGGLVRYHYGVPHVLLPWKLIEKKKVCWNCGKDFVMKEHMMYFYGVCDECYAKGYRSKDTKKEVDAFNLGKKVGAEEEKEKVD
jgi:hypothetical protein